jgi:hypothetical protein
MKSFEVVHTVVGVAGSRLPPSLFSMACHNPCCHPIPFPVDRWMLLRTSHCAFSDVVRGCERVLVLHYSTAGMWSTRFKGGICPRRDRGDVGTHSGGKQTYTNHRVNQTHVRLYSRLILTS